MADQKFSDWTLGLANAAPLAGTEQLPFVLGSANTKQATVDAIGNRTATRFGLVKNNVAAADPTSANDSSQGYAAGSFWFNTATGRAWFCVSAGVGAAVWSPAGAPLSAGYISGRYYGPPRSTSTSANATVADTIYAHRMVIQEAVTIDQIGARVVTGVAATSAWLGVYAESAGLPGALFAGTSAAVSTATSASNVAGTFVANPTLEPGTYWFATLTQGAVNFNNVSNGDPIPSAFMNYGSANQNVATNTTGQTFGVSAASAFAGGLPNPFPAATWQGTGALPMLCFRKA